MLEVNSKSLGNHVVSSEEKKERLQWEGLQLVRYELKLTQFSSPCT